MAIQAGYGCTKISETIIELETAGTEGVMVSIYGYVPGTESSISVAVQYSDPAINNGAFMDLAEQDAMEEKLKAFVRNFNATLTNFGFPLPLQKYWQKLRLIFTQNGGTGAAFTVAARPDRAI